MFINQDHWLALNALNPTVHNSKIINIKFCTGIWVFNIFINQVTN